MIKVITAGSFTRTEKFLGTISSDKLFSDLNQLGQIGLDALQRATPIDTGETEQAWSYRIVHKKEKWRIEWCNNHVQDGVNVAVILQYGHATGTGGYVQGIDYVNPAMKPVFESINNEIWRRVTNA